ncbi:hypothetical protein PQX77_014070 [Marasmius sp. AFHP31]|nr:hypothetical protein PQX77_014070 [Marasmius sp. AFHP31]
MTPEVTFDDIIHVDEFDRAFGVNNEGAVAEFTTQSSLEDQLRRLDEDIEELIQQVDPFNAEADLEYGGIEATAPVMYSRPEFMTGGLSNEGRKRTLSFSGDHGVEDEIAQKRMRRDDADENVGFVELSYFAQLTQ